MATTDRVGDLFRFESKALPESTRVAAFRGREGLSELYRFEIGLLVPEGADIDLDAAIGERATFVVNRGPDQEVLSWHGIIARIELMHAWHDRALYRVTLVPEIWRLTSAPHNYVLVDMSVPELIENRLKLAAPAEYELRLKEEYSKRPHLIQYKETHFAFISRWMERRGIYFYFEQGADCEKVIVTDHRGAHDELRTSPVRYVPSSGADTMALEALDSFVCVRTALPRVVRMRNYDHQNPNLVVAGSADIAKDDRGGGVDIHGDYFNNPEAGKRIAAVYAGAELARRQVHHGSGRVFGLRPGYRFAMEGHPIDRLNHEYLTTSLEHEGNQAADDDVRRLLDITHKDEYRVTLTAIDADVQYRTERRTPWPRIYSMERAFVDGATDSPYAQIDGEGRYKVQIAFDQSWDQSGFDGTGSAWVRMMQPHGGEVEGFHFPLRRGTEVVLSFMGGDPDQPVIAGVVPNALRVSPVTSANHTHNVIQTGSNNRVEMEDLKDKQYIDISTPPKDTRIHLGEPHGEHGAYIVFNTEGNQLVNIGGNRDVEVGGSLKEHVKGDVTWNHDSHRLDNVKAGVDENYKAHQVTTITGTRSELVSGACDEEYAAQKTYVAGERKETYGTQFTNVGGSLTYNAGATNLTFANTQFNSGTTGFKFGPTALTFGPTTLDWGATSGRIASFDIKASSWKVTVPDEGWNCTQFEFAGSKKTEITGFSAGYTGCKVELCGISASTTGVKLENVGVQRVSEGTKIETGGPRIFAIAVSALSAGLISLS